jgi:glyoxylase-like metal-dependent hydrolase (beta-lactamase superfamily II)
LATASQAAAVSALGGSLLRAAVAQTASAALTQTSVRDGLTLITGGGSNVLVLTATNRAGAVIVDSGAPEYAAQLAQLVRDKLGADPVEWLFNTHWHPSHTGGNEAIRSPHTTIVAH